MHQRPDRWLIVLLATLPGCDLESPDEQDIAALERESEALELDALDALDDPARAEEVSWSLELELAPPPAEGTCGAGHWESKGVSAGCNTCWDPAFAFTGKKYDLYKRWCWDGPGCGGCDAWQYYGWSCLQGCW